MTDYYYPKLSGEYTWHIGYKIELAIGKKPGIWTNNNNQTILRFHDYILTPEEKQIVNGICSDPTTAADAPTLTLQGNSWMFKDLWEEWTTGTLKADLEAAAGCSWTIWFPKENESDPKPNRIRFDPEKVLTQAEWKKVEAVFASLTIGRV